MLEHRRTRIASLAGIALLTAAVVAVPGGEANAARTVKAAPMPRLVVADDDEIVVVDDKGRSTVYASDGDLVWALDTATDRMDWPVEGKVTSEFGQRGGRMHNGIDIGAPIGKKITAAAGGDVTFAGWKGGYGKTVEIDHGDGTTTRYAHLATTKVSEDDRVSRGDKIGEIGMTGSTTGPHLHFEVHDSGDERDPRTLLIDRT